MCRSDHVALALLHTHAMVKNMLLMEENVEAKVDQQSMLCLVKGLVKVRRTMVGQFKSSKM